MKRLLWLVCVVVGALTGAYAGDRRGPLFTAPQALDPSVWHVVVPEMTADVKTVDSGRGSFVRGEALVFGEYAFGRADRLIPQGAPVVDVLELDLAPDSGPLELVWQGPDRTLGVRASTDTLGTAGDQVWTRDAGTLRLERVDGHIVSGGIDLGQVGPGTIELTSLGGAKLNAVRAWGPGDTVVLDVDYRTGGGRGWIPGAVVGALIGLAFAACTRSRGGVVAAALALLPPLWVMNLDHHDYVGLVERFYLDARAWEVAAPLLAASLVPLAAVAWGVLVQPGRRDRRRPGWWVQGVAALGVAAIASRDLSGVALLWAIPGAAVLAMPTLLAWRSRLPVAWILGADVPALALVAALGWAGLAPALGVRLVVVLAALPRLVAKAQRPTADHLFVTALLALVTAETSLRAAVGDRWDDIGETQLRVGQLEPFWKGVCGEGATVVFGGGSSTGGAYQFLDDPEAFYPTVAHQALCQEHGLTTWNYGHGGRNSHVLAQAIEPLLDYTQADVMVLYVGVNDLLTTHSTLTRRQRDARAGGGQTWLRHSRALTALGLAFRPAADEGGQRVSDVPLPDAEDNLRRIAAAAAAREAQVLLVPQVIAPSIAGQLDGYWAMQTALAAELDNVHVADVRAAVEATPQPLLDTNHMSREGNRALGQALAPHIAGLLD